MLIVKGRFTLRFDDGKIVNPDEFYQITEELKENLRGRFYLPTLYCNDAQITELSQKEAEK